MIWLVSPRMPADRSHMVFCGFITLALCMAAVPCGAVCAVFGAASGRLSIQHSWVVATVVVFLAYACGLRWWRYKLANAVEIASGAVIFFWAVGVAPPPLVLPLVGVGALAVFRPLTDGPEPHGWRPYVEGVRRTQQRERMKEKLKGRREK